MAAGSSVGGTVTMLSRCGRSAYVDDGTYSLALLLAARLKPAPVTLESRVVTLMEYLHR